MILFKKDEKKIEDERQSDTIIKQESVELSTKELEEKKEVDAILLSENTHR